MSSYLRSPSAVRRMAAGLGFGLLLPHLAVAQTEVQRRVEATAGGRVEIANIAGSVTVFGWDQNRVEVTGVLSRGVEELEIYSRAGRIKIEVEPKRHHPLGGDADLEVKVPRGSRVSVETVSAEIRVTGVRGELDIESVSGSVEADAEPESVEAETVSGNITVGGGRGRVQVGSVNGTVRIRGGRHIEAGTVSGEILVEGVEDVRFVELEAVSGRVRFEGGLASGADVSASSHNGSIELTLSGSVSARFQVSSFSGRIHNELGPPARRERFSPARELEFETGSGDARIRVESFGGSITLNKR